MSVVHEPRAVVAERFSSLAATLVERRPAGGAVLVGIDGFAGSGKTSFAVELAAAFGRAHLAAWVIPFDRFWFPKRAPPALLRQSGVPGLGHDYDYDYDWPAVRDLVLLPLVRNEPATFMQFAACRLGIEARVVPDAVLVEGFSATRIELAGLYDFRVMLQASRQARLLRLAGRDGGDLINWYRTVWALEEEHYLRTHAPLDRADLLVDTSDPPPDGADFIAIAGRAGGQLTFVAPQE